MDGEGSETDINPVVRNAGAAHTKVSRASERGIQVSVADKHCTRY
jgi:hypothetical protein